MEQRVAKLVLSLHQEGAVRPTLGDKFTFPKRSWGFKDEVALKQREKDALAREMKEHVRREVRLGGKHRRHQGLPLGSPYPSTLEVPQRLSVGPQRQRQVGVLPPQTSFVHTLYSNRSQSFRSFEQA